MWNLNLVIASTALLLGCSNAETTPADLRAEAMSRAYRTAVMIPDADPRGIRLGPLPAPYGLEGIDNVGLYLELMHPNAADVEVYLSYDADNDGIEEAQAQVEFYRGKMNGWFQPEPHSCPQALAGRYYFGGAGEVDSPFASLRGLKTGGSFYLTIVDSMADDRGFIQDWGVRGADAMIAATVD